MAKLTYMGVSQPGVDAACSQLCHRLDLTAEASLQDEKREREESESQPKQRIKHCLFPRFCQAQPPKGQHGDVEQSHAQHDQMGFIL